MLTLVRMTAAAALFLLGGCIVASVTPPPVAPPLAVGTTAAPQGFTCYAGVYVCPAPAGTPAGSNCSCPGLGAPSFGVVN